MEVHIGTSIAAVGALGTAAFGLTETLGKTIVFGRRFGLPMVGYGCVRELVKALEPALHVAYGAGNGAGGAEEVIRQAYRKGRGKGDAPDLIRQGVRLGLPFLGVERAGAVIDRTWGMGGERSRELALALQHRAGDVPEPDAAAQEAAGMAARFGAVLDHRIRAAFELAEARYRAAVRSAAGMVAVALSLLFAAYHPLTGTGTSEGGFVLPTGSNLVLALVVGLAAVPLAPVAKDLSSGLSAALKAWRDIAPRSRP